MSVKNMFAAIALLIGTHGVAYWYGSNKPAEVKTVFKEVVKRDVVTVIKEIVKPDGTKETTTSIVDKSKENTSSKSKTTSKQRDWLVGAYYRVNEPTYALLLQRRILGPLFIGVHADLKGNYYGGISYEF